MRGSILGILVCLSITCFAARSEQAFAASGDGKKVKVSRKEEQRAYSLEDIMKAPSQYLEREVFFYCRFATTANLFKNVSTRFNANEYTNFAVWPDKTRLWETEGRKNILPTLYVPKNKPEMMATLHALKRYELIAITGMVLNVYARCPWILVTKIEQIEQPQDQINAAVVEHMQSGHEALRSNFGGIAARHYEQALQFGLPPEYRAKAYEQLARSYILDNQLDKARDYLRQAVECDRSDALLNLALADLCLRMGDAEEALAHCQFALENSGRYPQVYGMMGEANAMLGNYVKAFEDLNAAAGTPGISPRERAMINVRRARIYSHLSRYTDAARAYAALSEPGEPLAGEGKIHNEIGLFYEKLFLDSQDERYLESAFAAYAEAARLERADASYLYNMAETEFRRQKLAAAPDMGKVRERIEAIHRVEPEFAPARILEGRVLYAEGKPSEAEYLYQSVANQIASDALALLALSEAYFDLNMAQEGLAVLRRAESLQPWNPRIQALGKHLKNAAAKVAENKGQPGRTEMRQKDAVKPSGGERDAGVEDAVRSVPGQKEESPRRAVKPVSIASTEGEGRRISVRPGERVRVGSDGSIRHEAADEYPQNIQAAAQPAPVPGRSASSRLVTEVHLPPEILANKGLTDGTAPISRSSLGMPEPLPLDYVPGKGNVLENETPAMKKPAKDAALADEYPWMGAIPGTTQAYASLPLMGTGDLYQGDADAMPPPFTFEPGASPELIADVGSYGNASGRDLPVRNANLYRSLSGGRRPAEIIEKEPLRPMPTPTPEPVLDASGMAPSGNGRMYRTEVRLPSTSQGIGMASDSPAAFGR